MHRLISMDMGELPRQLMSTTTTEQVVTVWTRFHDFTTNSVDFLDKRLSSSTAVLTLHSIVTHVCVHFSAYLTKEELAITVLECMKFCVPVSSRQRLCRQTPFVLLESNAEAVQYLSVPMAESKVYVDAARKPEQDAQGATQTVVSVQAPLGKPQKKADRCVYWLDDLWRTIKHGLGACQVKPDGVTELRIKEAIVSVALEFAFTKTATLRDKEFLVWSRLRPAIIQFIEDILTHGRWGVGCQELGLDKQGGFHQELGPDRQGGLSGVGS